ncbi:ChaB family protein [Microcoleus sp. FACHB-53]|jgi:cation transport regulator ChaB|nr:ChaB family protein [Microcoleus sp. FACHB-53]MBD2126883.1 ChaB family protein [Microcoleus sp. FACHB-1]
MPYPTIEDLPDSVKNHVPKHAQEIFRAAFNRIAEVPFLNRRIFVAVRRK